MVIVAVGVLVVPPLLDRFHTRRFTVAKEGVLYRMGQPTEEGLEKIVRRYGIRTVITTRLEDPVLRHDLFDLGEPSGATESAVIARLGAEHFDAPFPPAWYWPWPAPDHFERLIDLLGDERRQPVLVHCHGGRHRTGTIVALYRLEYDRWPVEQAMREMYSFDFGVTYPVHELNLRTYWPRPRPDDEEWRALVEVFGRVVPDGNDYESLVRAIIDSRHDAQVRAMLVDYVARRRPLALPLAQRVLQAWSRSGGVTQDDALARTAGELALRTLSDVAPGDDELSAAAALIADFGTPDHQERLLGEIEAGSRASLGDRRRWALVLGVASRYAESRLPFLRPLLDDDRTLPLSHHSFIDEHGNFYRFRYCDLAVARVCSITGAIVAGGDCSTFRSGREQARRWFEQHPEAGTPSRFSGLPWHHATARDYGDQPALRR